MKKYIFPIAILAIATLQWTLWIYLFHKNDAQQLKAQSAYFNYTGLNVQASYYVSFIIVLLLIAGLGYTIGKLKARVPQTLLILLHGFFILLTLWALM